MKGRVAGALALWLLAVGAGMAQELAEPPPGLVLQGVPPIPAELARSLQPYGEFRPHRLLSWHPTRREMLVRRRLETTVQVHHVAAPGAAPRALTDDAEAIHQASYPPTHAEYLVFSKGAGGNEVYRLYRYDMADGRITPISLAGERAGTPAWSPQGDRIAFTTVPIDRNNRDRALRTTLHLVDPREPQNARVLARFDGGGWTGFRFSPDGKRLAFVEHLSAEESHLWVLEVATGRKQRVSPPTAGGRVSYRRPYFSHDGEGLFATSDRDSEFERLVYLPLAGGREEVLTGHLAYDVDALEVSHDAGLAAFLTNENGAHVLRFLDAKTRKELPRPPLVDGVIGGLQWRPGSSEVGFHISSARTAGDVFSYDVQANRVTRWTNGNSPGLNTSAFSEPRLVRWKSFDGREITGLHYHPPARFDGRRPVIVVVHGGPESQSRPRFIGRFNYFVSEMGVALVYPNVRGSSGFGKTFLGLDNGRRREDAVRDIGALLDWIASQPELDAQRVLVLGGSYGGYMALAAAWRFADRIAGAVSVVGISSFATFLERTESYRRDLRRAEYGDERDPAMRAFLDAISPLHHAGEITRPLFVIHGRNDPRVPFGEAEQIVEALRARGTPVWFMAADDEGHGFVKKPNVDYMFWALVQFARRTLLP